MLDISKPFWDMLTKVITIDYPTRSMMVVTFIGSLLGGLLIVSLKKFRLPAFITLVIIALYTNRNHIRVNQVTNFPLSFYLINEKTTNTHDEYLPKDASRDLLYQSGLLSSNKDVINQFAFPGQIVYINNIKSNYTVNSDGRINIKNISPTDHVQVRFEESYLIKLSKSLSVIGLLILSYVILHKYFTLNKSYLVKPKK